MKALLKKDIFVLIRQMRMFLVMIVVFSVLPGMNMSIFAIVYCGMLPYTAMAYDERSKWTQLAAMMPYTPGHIVLSKYAGLAGSWLRHRAERRGKSDSGSLHSLGVRFFTLRNAALLLHRPDYDCGDAAAHVPLRGGKGPNVFYFTNRCAGLRRRGVGARRGRV